MIRKGKYTVAILIAIAAMIASNRASAANVGQLSAPQQIEAGDYAYVVPPVRVEGDRHVVVVSAPRRDWIVKGGPFHTYSVPISVGMSTSGAAQCQQTLNQSVLFAKSNYLGKQSAALSSPLVLARATFYQKQGMTMDDALQKAADEFVEPSLIAKLQAENAKCEISDGGPMFRIEPTIRPSNEADYLR